MSVPDKDIFFIGWSKKLPVGLRRILPAVAVLLLLAFPVMGYVIALGQDNPGTGRFRWDLGPQEVTGVLTTTPYPTVTLTEETELLPKGHVLMTAGPGKRGADLAAAGSGDLVTVRGVLLTRGSLDMMQVDTVSTVGRGDLAPDETLGRWRLTGEICDGKCLSGAMRPGKGLSHKACAELCLLGDVPPVFVTPAPVVPELEGSDFLLLAGPDGGPMPDALLGKAALLVGLDGEILRRGDMLIFRADPDTVEVLR
ncbi:hypothetical protein [Chachezhania sediminis]|uniref:hypothetical protein n=1 Tax=Chachezhania sediminis TaxID=2599291 RepID=UPI001E5E3034|nr:hypothetical protein [Chachezhania sediminis]